MRIDRPLLTGVPVLMTAVLCAGPAAAGTAPDAHTSAVRPASAAGDAIGAHYRQLGGARSFLGVPVGGPRPVGAGLVQAYVSGAIFWSPSTGAWSVHGGILARYQALGGATGVLGFPVTDETGTPDGAGRYNHFSGNGSIHWSPAATAARRSPSPPRAAAVARSPATDPPPTAGGPGGTCRPSPTAAPSAPAR